MHASEWKVEKIKSRSGATELRGRQIVMKCMLWKEIEYSMKGRNLTVYTTVKANMRKCLLSNSICIAYKWKEIEYSLKGRNLTVYTTVGPGPLLCGRRPSSRLTAYAFKTNAGSLLRRDAEGSVPGLCADVYRH
eukprot:366431-Chlamydomonas_euryale.AAC.3